MINRKYRQDSPIVFTRDYFDFDKSLRVLRQRMNASGIFRILKDKKHAIKPSEIKQQKQRRAELRRIQKEKKQQKYER